MLLLLHDLIPTLLTLIRIHHNEIVVDLLNVLGILSKTILLIVHLVLLYSSLVLLLARIHLLKLLLIVEILLRLLLLLLLHLLSIQVHLLLHLLHLVILLLVTHLVHLLVLIPMEVLSLIVVAHFFLLILLVASVLVKRPGAVVKELVTGLQILGDVETRRRKHVLLASMLAFVCRTVRLIASIKQLVRFLHVASSFPTLLYLLEQTRNRLIQQLTLGVYKFTSGSAIIISIMKFPIVF